MTTENALADNVDEAVPAAPIVEEAALVVVEPEPLTPEQTAEKEKKEHSEKVQKRINSEVGKRRQAEAAQRKAEVEAAELRGAEKARLEAATAQPVTVQDAPEPPGGRETFATDDEWLAAHKVYDAHQLREGIRKEFKEGQEAQAEQNKIDRQKEIDAAEAAKSTATFVESINNARKNHEDYDDVIKDPSVVMSKELVNVLQTSENPGEVAYLLAKNPAESERISSLSPLDIAREIGKIEVRLAEPKKKTSNAPDPLTPLNPGTEIVGKHPDNMSQAEYEKWREGS